MIKIEKITPLTYRAIVDGRVYSAILANNEDEARRDAKRIDDIFQTTEVLWDGE